MSVDLYIQNLALAPDQHQGFSFPDAVSVRRGLRTTEHVPEAISLLPSNARAVVNANALLSFVDGVSPTEQEDVLFSVQLAVRAASGSYDRFTQTQAWYQKYTEVLENLGWFVEQFAFAPYRQEEGEIRMDRAALAVVAAIATQNQLLVVQESIKALEKLAEDDGTLRLFDFHTATRTSGNFQVGSVQRADNGALALALGAFHFRCHDSRRRFLFFSWGSQQVNFWTAAQKLTLNTAFYAPLRAAVRRKLGADALDYIAALPTL